MEAPISILGSNLGFSSAFRGVNIGSITGAYLEIVTQ